MNLFYLSDVKYGGWPSFTAHLARGLQALDEPVYLFKVGNTTESRHRDFGRTMSYRNLCLEDALGYADGGLVVVAAPKQQEATAALLGAGASLVIHDPTEVKGAAAELVPLARRLITVRRANLEMLTALGGKPYYVGHPYLRCPVSSEVTTRLLACAISRIDFDKHTDLIAAANIDLARDGQRIAIYGAENRLYTHHKLEKDYPQWRDAYKGRFDTGLWDGYKIARRYRSMVDMSVIKGDGGGTQYTHLEALDAGCRLILNTGWWQQDGEVNDVAQFCVDPVRLAELVRADQWPDPALVDGLLARHDATDIARQYMELLA